MTDAITLSPEHRRLGGTELSTFPIAYGCWRFAGGTVADARRKIDAALEVGINLFDHADIYGGDGAAEELFGRALAEAPGLRSRMLLATKGGIVIGVPYDSSRQHLLDAAEGSLRRLRTDVLDLYQIHRPDLLTHPEEVAGALATLRDQGKIREVGVSNFTPAQTEALQRFLPFRLATSQPEMSCWWLASFTDGTLDLCQRDALTPLAWSPLAGGKIGLAPDQAAKETNGARLAALVARLDELAARESVPRSAVALAFLLAHPSGVVPIIGTQNVDRIRESVASLSVRLNRADWYSIFAASQGKPLP